jgi:hypothetical protein
MTAFTSKFGLVSLCLNVAFFGCGKTSDGELNAGSGSPSTGLAGGAGAGVQLEVSGTGNLGSGGSLAGVGGMPGLPTVGCVEAGSENAGAAGMTEECNAPPSSCADWQHLVYYSSGGCVAGACTWTAATLECPERCSNGACVASTTEK